MLKQCNATAGEIALQANGCYAVYFTTMLICRMQSLKINGLHLDGKLMTAAIKNTASLIQNKLVLASNKFCKLYLDFAIYFSLPFYFIAQLFYRFKFFINTHYYDKFMLYKLFISG